jgi:hypothetical protein
MSTNPDLLTPPAGTPRRPVVVAPGVAARPPSANGVWALIAGVVSVAAHAVLFLLLLNIGMASGDTGAADDSPIQAEVGEPPKDELDLTNTDVGNNTDLPTQYDVGRIEDVSVPGPVDPAAAPGIGNAPESAPATTLPPPPGFGGGTGAALKADDAGAGALFGTPGGLGGSLGVPGGFGPRASGATRERMLQEGGGNAVSEASVARGLKWLALHQAADGHWSLNGFSKHAREAPLGHGGKTFTCNCGGAAARSNDIAATAFGLLPFLAAGQTHKPPKDKKPNLVDYTKTVDGGLKFLVGKQGKDGAFVGEMYAHSLATIAVCEAYGMTSDPLLKVSAQNAVNYLVQAQDPAGGGWRYSPRASPGDTSVTGWALMALKSGQMAGLNVPAATLKRTDRFLDSVEANAKGGFGYTPGSAERETMTAVGLLCRQYLGVNPRNPGLQAGVDRLKQPGNAPGKTGNIYYEYYATQVMHHMGGEAWQYWNLGPGGKGGIRDTLIAKQDPGGGTKNHQAGSWGPETGGFATEGGRMMSTSLSLLTLEVYYRHLPLYRRDMGVTK